MFAFDLGGPEIIIVLVVILVLFGGSQLPKLARGLGEAKNEFEKGIKTGDGAAESGSKDESA